MKKLMWPALALALVILGIIQFIPTKPVVAPATLPQEQRSAHRLLGFEGIANFRDLGGYPSEDGRQVRWGSLYRAGTFAHSSRSDLQALQQLGLTRMVDFRSQAEKEEEPNRLPEPLPFEIIEIPTLDDGNAALRGEIMTRIDSGNFDGFDPDYFMLEANRQFANEFTPQFREFIDTVLEAKGEPMVWHCSAGKDRTGYAAAILLRILGVSQEVVMEDYMASKQLALDARRNQLLMLRLFKGEEAAEKLGIMLGVEEAWLEAAFAEIDRRWGSFEAYVSDGLQLSPSDIKSLRDTLLVAP